MALIAASLYWVIVAIWLCVLACAVYYGWKSMTIFGSARILLIVIGVDTVRDIAENVYFGLYFGSQYGLLSRAIAPVLGQPVLLMMPKVMNVLAGLLVLFMLFRNWLPKASTEHQAMGVLASVDSLTGLFNRRRFMELAAAEIERCHRYQHPFAVLMIDIDHFKSVNDQYGHQTGDNVIREIAAIIRKATRASDVAARVGGEEFAILLPETNLDNATRFADRVRAEVAAAVIPADGTPLQATISIGLGEHDTQIAIEELLKRADSALYDAKRGGRNQVRAYAGNF